VGAIVASNYKLILIIYQDTIGLMCLTNIEGRQEYNQAIFVR